jgi:hypothetical protein
MADVEHSDITLLVVDLIDNPKISDTEAPPIAPCQLEAAEWSRVFCKLTNDVADTGVRRRVQLGEFFLGAR